MELTLEYDEEMGLVEFNISHIKAVYPIKG